MKGQRFGPAPTAELDAAVDGLKPFQQATVAAVTAAMFDRGTKRFLVADEVGLGKTKVARAVVARTIRELWDDRKVDRIDIIYICSNQQIARQNVTDLDVLRSATLHQADRLTMLPAALADLNKKRVNLVAFTPDTSFKHGQARGRAEERALLFHILAQDNVVGPKVMSRRGAHALLSLGAKSFDAHYDWYSRHVDIPRSFGRAYRKILRDRGLLAQVEYLSDGRRKASSWERQSLIGMLRRSLALACVKLLSPDLVILDEFQRFTTLLDGKGDDGELARALFDQPSCRVLLLSATPYKPLSGAESGETHLDGFARTLKFLLGDEATSRVLSDLSQLRRGLVGNASPQELEPIRDRAQDALRDAIVRTERLGATVNRNGMLDTDINATCLVSTTDVQAFIGNDRIAQSLKDVPSIVEYWKSSPYLFNFMDEYVVKKRIRQRWAARDRDLKAALEGGYTLDWDSLDQYAEIDTRNPRARWLVGDLARHRAFVRLWMPPTLAQTELSGAYAGAEGFTKRLIFSGWAVAPKAVSALISYEYERRHHRDGKTYRSRESANRLAVPSLTENASERFTNFALFLPSRRLAEIGDPLRIARTLGKHLPLNLMDVRDHVRRELEGELEGFVAQAPRDGRPRNVWYAAALCYLDRSEDVALQDMPSSAWAKDERAGGIGDHLAALREHLADPARMGPAPEDLIERLTDLAIAGPAVCSLRALERVRARLGIDGQEAMLNASARISWGLRSLFNAPESDALVSAAADDDYYWRLVLQHAADGALGSVLDEWLHLLPDQLRLSAASQDPLTKLADSAYRVLHLPDGLVGADFFDESQSSGSPRNELLRTHFAMRFGQARGVTAEGENPFEVRLAFNSPFKPFVLMSTSVGQEGLDFHHYAHAVVHWNLPRGPVDLEQREGRVHRYKNHAVRKNVAARFRTDPEMLGAPDPWDAMFRLAATDPSGMQPWWVFPGGASIQRLVPMMPMSREQGRLAELVKATTIYRMTLGQARQYELMEVLAELTEEEREELRSAITIDLSPPTQTRMRA